MSAQKITTELLKSVIDNLMIPEKVPYQELAAHGCVGATRFTWKRLEKRKILPADGDFSFLLDLAGETNAEGWVDPNFTGAVPGVHWLRTFILKDVKFPKGSKNEDDEEEEFHLPDACFFFITNDDDTQILAWAINVD